MKLLFHIDLPPYIESNTDLNKKLKRTKALARRYFWRFLDDEEILLRFDEARFGLLGNDGCVLSLVNDDDYAVNASVRLYNQHYDWKIYKNGGEFDFLDDSTSQKEAFLKFKKKFLELTKE
jgi:hypothetical protein